eukprot:2892672-Amphidinium_carterae.1
MSTLESKRRICQTAFSVVGSGKVANVLGALNCWWCISAMVSGVCVAAYKLGCGFLGVCSQLSGLKAHIVASFVWLVAW